MKRTSKAVAILMALLMVLCLLPTSFAAADGTDDAAPAIEAGETEGVGAEEQSEATEPEAADPEAEPVEAPVGAEPEEAPVEAEPVEEPVEAEPVEAPVEAEPEEAPVEAEPVEEPVEAEPEEEPVEAEPEEAPVGIEKKEGPVGFEPLPVDPIKPDPEQGEEPMGAESLLNGFYLIGLRGWTVDDLDPVERFTVNPENANEYMLSVKLAVGDEVKVVKVESSAITAWYPDSGGNYVVTAGNSGDVTVYFNETWNNDWGGHIYVQRNGAAGTEADPYIVTSDTTEFVDGGYYLVNENVTVDSRIYPQGTATLILGEGATLTASKGIFVGGDRNLTIKGSGKLIATGDYLHAGIGSDHMSYGTITIEDGEITATGGKYGAGIGGGHHSNTGGRITITGGKITATGGQYGAGIGGGGNDGWAGHYASAGEILITGGEVTAIGSGKAAGIGGGAADGGGDAGNVGRVTITGGKITATSTGDGYGVGPGLSNGGANAIVLSWSDASDWIKIKSYKGTSVVIADGYAFTDGENTYSGTLTDEQISAIADKELSPANEAPATYTVTVASTTHGTVKAVPVTAAAGAQITLTVTPDHGYELVSLAVVDAENNPVEVTDNRFTMPASNVTVTAVFRFIERFNVIIADSIEYGTVTPSPSVAAAGAQIALTITPDEGYWLETLTVTDANGQPVEVTDNRFVMPASNVTVTATFKPNYQIAIADGIEHGTVTASLSSAAPGTEITVDYTPDEGWVMCSITVTDADGDPVALSDDFKFTMPAKNVTISASFEPGYAITVVIDPAEPFGECSVNCLMDGRSTTLGAAGKTITVSVNATFYEHTVTVVDANGDPVTVTNDTFVMPESAVTVTVDLSLRTVSVGVPKAITFTYGGTFITFTAPRTAWYGFYSTCSKDTYGYLYAENGTTCLTYNDDGVNQYGVYYGRQFFMQRELTEGTVVRIKAQLYYSSDDPADGTVNVILLSHDVEIAESTGGTVTADKTNPVKVSETVTLTVAPDDDYELDTLTVVSGENTIETTEGNDTTYTFTMPNAPVSVSATFKKTVFAVTVAESEHGSVTASAEKAAVGETVTLTVAPDFGYELDTLTVTDAEENPVPVAEDNTFVMPESDVTVTAAFKLGNIIIADTENLSDGETYYVLRDVTNDHRIKVNGTVVIELGAGTTLTATKGIEVDKNSRLTIRGEGALIATANADNAAIGGTADQSGRIIIEGGTITATGGLYAAGIGGGLYGSTQEITIRGGSVTATGGLGGAGIGGGCNMNYGGHYGNCDAVTITGGTVRATAGAKGAAGIGGGGSYMNVDAGAGNVGTITIVGGNVTATSPDGYGVGPGLNIVDSPSNGTAGTILLGWRNETDSIRASTYNALEVKVAGGCRLTDGTNSYGGTLTEDQITAIAGKTLTPAGDPLFLGAVTIAEGIEHGSVIAEQDLVMPGETVVFYAVPEEDWELDTLTVTDGESNAVAYIHIQGTAYSFDMPESDVTITATFKQYVFYVTITESEHGSVTADVPKAQQGETVTLTVTPDEGYVLDTLTVVDGEGTPIDAGGAMFEMPASNVTVTATFKLRTFTVTVEEVQYGTVTADPTEAAPGATVTLTVEPDEDYELATLSVLDESNTPVECTRTGETTYTFIMPASNVTVSAEFGLQMWVGGRQLTEENAADILGDRSVSYDIETHTLTFATATPELPSDYQGYLIFTALGDLTIDMPNELTLASDTAKSVIYVVDYSGSLTVNGKLNAEITAKENSNAAIFAYGNIVFDGDLNLKTTGTGVYAPGTDSIVTINGSAAIETAGQAVFGMKGISIAGDANIQSQSGGLQAPFGSITVGGDAVVNAKGAAFSATDSSSVVAIGGSATISGSGSYGVLCPAGTVTVEKDFTAIGSWGEIVLFGGTGVTVKGAVKIESTSGIGIQSNGSDIVIGKADIKTTGDCIHKNSSGKVVVNGDLTCESNGGYAVFSNGGIFVNGNAKVVNTVSYGLYATGDSIVIDGNADIETVNDGINMVAYREVRINGNAKIRCSDASNAFIYAPAGGKVIVEGDLDASGISDYGVFGMNGVTLNGNVTIKNDDVYSGGAGLYSPGGTILVKGNADIRTKNECVYDCGYASEGDVVRFEKNAVLMSSSYQTVFSVYGPIRVGGNLTIVNDEGAGINNPSMSGNTTGVFVGGSVNISTLDTAIDCKGDVVLKDEVNIHVDGKDMYGIKCTGTIYASYKWDVEATKAALYADGGIELTDLLTVTLPEDGEIKQLVNPDDTTVYYWTVTAPGGDEPAAHVVIAATPVYGDVNCDGRITSADAAALLRAVVGLKPLSARGAGNADVDGDGEITATDAAIILRYVVGLIEYFPVSMP